MSSPTHLTSLSLNANECIHKMHLKLGTVLEFPLTGENCHSAVLFFLFVMSSKPQYVFCPLAEACSTTEDGDEPLHCPTGYECHIINLGNPAAGIPNRGQCIKQRGNSGMARVFLVTEIAE